MVFNNHKSQSELVSEHKMLHYVDIQICPYLYECLFVEKLIFHIHHIQNTSLKRPGWFFLIYSLALLTALKSPSVFACNQYGKALMCLVTYSAERPRMG